ncbi:hypothetical protein Bca52824_073371 [Brassica carinata]|uniref:Uncharacterized protein n=1 Tax=Brassica carinata TaxID=52824 RepID=A0A8X7QBG5_BRACI|nr:hypothetical protein Bca52824_073371 [Brassica carinata]
MAVLKRHQLTAGSMFSVSGFDVILFLLLFGEENLKIQMKGVKALETPGASKDLHRLERHLQWLVVYSSMPHHDTLPTLKTQKCRLHREESGRPASTEAEPTHTDSVITSTETPIDDEKTPVQRKLANTDNSNCGDLELAKHNRVHLNMGVGTN